MDDYDDPGWFQISEFGHNAYNEFLIEYDPYDSPDSYKKMDQCYIALIKQDVDERCYNGLLNNLAPLGLTGPAYDNYHLLLRKLKGVFDPNNLSNPPRPFDLDEVVEKHAPWVPRDWPSA